MEIIPATEDSIQSPISRWETLMPEPSGEILSLEASEEVPGPELRWEDTYCLRQFLLLAEQWYEERGVTSSFSKMTSCPSYLRIIGMGPKAVPLIISQLKREGRNPDHWFVALQAITGEDPIREEARGNTVSMAQAWLDWAEKNGVW